MLLLSNCHRIAIVMMLQKNFIPKTRGSRDGEEGCKEKQRQGADLGRVYYGMS